jgi:hypothetical protein
LSALRTASGFAGAVDHLGIDVRVLTVSVVGGAGDRPAVRRAAGAAASDEQLACR